MTVTNETSRTSAEGTSGEQIVPFLFPIVDNSDIKVYTRVTSTGVQAPLAETTHFTVLNNGDSGGSITTVAPYVASGTEIHIVRDTPNTQGLDLEQGGTFNAESLEDAFDKNCKLITENVDALDRTIRFPETDPTTAFGELPNSKDRASKLFTFDPAGKPAATTTIPEGSVTFSAIGTNIAEAANAGTERGLIELSSTDTVEFADLIVKSPWRDVRAYGATGDGVTDDHAAIVAAIAAASNFDVIFFPIGDYILSETLVIAKQVTLKGGGFGHSGTETTRLIWTQTDGTNGIEPSIAIMIDGLEIRGNTSAGNGIEIDTGSPTGGFVFRDMMVRVWGGHAFNASQFYINEFYNCTFRNADGDGIHLEDANENRFYSSKSQVNGGTADVYLDDGGLNYFDLDTGNGSASWCSYFTGECHGNIIKSWNDGGNDRGIFLDTKAYNNDVFYQGGASRDVKDKGLNNRAINTRMPVIPTYQYASNSVPLTKNQVTNPSGVLDTTVGWTRQSGIVWTRNSGEGMTTGTCHQFDYDAAAGADAGQEFWTNFSDAVVQDDLVVVQFWMKTDRVLTSAEKIDMNLLGDGESFDLFPQNGCWIDVTTEWQFFQFAWKAEDSNATKGMAARWRADGATGYDVLTAALTIYITDVAMYINPQGIPSQSPFIFSGGTTEYVNYPISNTGRLEQMGRLVNLGVAPANPEPGAIAMADGMNWDPLSTGTSCSELVFYGQSILVGDDYKWTAGGGGTNEYYVELAGGGDPGLSEPDEVRIDGVAATSGTVDSLAAGEWDYADSDALGYSTIYVRLTGGGDPDAEDDGAITAMRWTAFGNEALK